MTARDGVAAGEWADGSRGPRVIPPLRDSVNVKRLEAEDFRIPALTLQPIVENAIYHGIKNKRNGGTIVVRARPWNDSEVLFQVEDDGIGVTAEKLAQLQAELADDAGEMRLESGYGLGNVHKRIRLYYGKQYGVTVQSQQRVGTCASIVIPARCAEVEGRRQ